MALARQVAARSGERELDACAIVFLLGEAAGTVVHVSDLAGGDLGAAHVPLPVLVGDTFDAGAGSRDRFGVSRS